MKTNSRLLGLAVLVLLFLSTRLPAQQLIKVDDPPPAGTFYSMQLDLPPFPFNPFPALDVYAWGNTFFYDDTEVDYLALMLEQGGFTTMSGPPMPGEGEPGEGGGPQYPPAYNYGTNDLWLEFIGMAEGIASLLIHTPETNGVYDLFMTTSLSPDVPGLNLTNWMWLARTAPGETNLAIGNLWPTEGYFRLGTMLDSDSDGLTDAYEKLVSHTDYESADTDGDGIPDGWEVAHGLNPRTDDADEDPDDDGLTNAQEFQGGSHPFDPMLVVWGDDLEGQSSVPWGFFPGTGFAGGGTRVRGGHTVALTPGGTVLAWGVNGFNQTNVPSGLSNVVMVAAGGK